MFTFPIVAVREVIERGKADAAINGGFRNPYYGMKPGEGESPGLWLVADQGVYPMASGRSSFIAKSATRSAIPTGFTTSIAISGAMTASNSLTPRS